MVRIGGGGWRGQSGGARRARDADENGRPARGRVREATKADHARRARIGALVEVTRRGVALDAIGIVQHAVSIEPGVPVGCQHVVEAERQVEWRVWENEAEE